ncbi:hypothetical protein H109_06476, partial [Trichophyton interdigitale MR816]
LRLRLRLREGVVEGPVKLVNKLVGKAQSKLPRKRKSAQAIKSPPVGVQIQYYFLAKGRGFTELESYQSSLTPDLNESMRSSAECLIHDGTQMSEKKNPADVV